MPIIKTKSGKYKFGASGHEYDTRAEAVKQMKAMYAAGYKGSSSTKPTKKPTKGKK